MEPDKITNKIDGALNTTYKKIEEEDRQNNEVIDVDDEQPTSNPEAEEDFEEARTGIKSILGVGKVALEGAVGLAQACDSPKGYEVVATLLKNLTDANKGLIDIHQQKKDIEKKDDSNNNTEKGDGTTNNILFVGSTKDLQKKLFNMDQENTDDE